MSHTRRHMSEFVSIDIEQAFVTAEDVMQTLEQLVHYVCEEVNVRCKKELGILKHKVEVPEKPFRRFTIWMALPWQPTPLCCSGSESTNELLKSQTLTPSK